MMWTKILRWMLFFLVGIPFQILTYLAMPFLILYFYIYAKAKLGVPLDLSQAPKQLPIDQLISNGLQEPLRDQYFVNNQDTTGLLSHVYLYKLKPELYKPASSLMVYPNGSIYRRYPNEEWIPVSGDCLSSWVFSYTILNNDNKDDLRRLAKHYLSNCL